MTHIIITSTPRQLLEEMAGVKIANQMINDATDYLLRAKREAAPLSIISYCEIAAEREIWKEKEQVELSSEDQNYDQLSFMAAALELDMNFSHSS